jgi:deoxyribodipyrimidine photo-lyase
MDKKEISVFWFRRDLRLEDNCGLFEALKSNYPVLPVFIFDEEILNELPKNDARISFIHHSLQNLNKVLLKNQSSLYIKKGAVIDVWKKIITEFNVKNVFFNKDYEPYAIKRDLKVTELCKANNIEVQSFKDQVIFEENEIVKADAKPYTVYTPYKNKWWELFKNKELKFYPSEDLKNHFLKTNFNFPSIKEVDFVISNIKVKSINKNAILDYDKFRDFPLEKTSNFSVYLRFGLISIRNLFKYAEPKNTTFCNELIWREFFMQILYHFPFVVKENFKSKYNSINWRNNEDEFQLWCKGKTGYPIVDAGMKELNKTGYMHNRVRMITASFFNKTFAN